MTKLLRHLQQNYHSTVLFKQRGPTRKRGPIAALRTKKFKQALTHLNTICKRQFLFVSSLHCERSVLVIVVSLLSILCNIFCYWEVAVLIGIEGYLLGIALTAPRQDLHFLWWQTRVILKISIQWVVAWMTKMSKKIDDEKKAAGEKIDRRESGIKSMSLCYLKVTTMIWNLEKVKIDDVFLLMLL